MLSEPIESFERKRDCWLLVWGGSDDWYACLRSLLDKVTPASDDAHYILSQEVEGDRWSLLLVHYSGSECDFIVNKLRGLWTYGFVNAVLDLEKTEGNASCH